MAKVIGTLSVDLKVNLSLWSAIKLRISGLYSKPLYKVKIEELV